jgi:hypothetical protein
VSAVPLRASITVGVNSRASSPAVIKSFKNEKEKAIPVRADSGRERSYKKEKDEEKVIPVRVE